MEDAPAAESPAEQLDEQSGDEQDAADEEELAEQPAAQADTSASSGRGRRGKKKKKTGRRGKAVDLSALPIDDLCEQLGIADTQLDYSEQDLQEITNGKVGASLSSSTRPLQIYAQRYRQQFLDANPTFNVTKMGPYITAKYRQFQEEAGSRGVKKGKDEKTVAPLKIRISARKTKRKDEDDDGEAGGGGF